MKSNTKEMRNRIVTNEPEIINIQNVGSFVNPSDTSYNLVENNFISEILTAEGREDFANYIKGLGLDKDPNVIFLSSLHHYYYEPEEMKNVQTVINLKELNQIKEVKGFLHSVFHILSKKSNFIGCFVDNKKVNVYELKNSTSPHQSKISSDEEENGIVSHIPFLNMLYSLMDSKTNKFMSVSSVSLMLEESGFSVLNMKEINGLTYFHSQKLESTSN